MFDNICSLPLTSDFFAQTIHPEESILAIGLSAGHVESYRLPPAANHANDVSNLDESSDAPQTRRHSAAASENGLGQIESIWRTRRHKGSCRSLAYSPEGSLLFSAGTDGLVKAARSEDGRVIAKIAIPDAQSKPDSPSLVHVLTPQILVLSTDSSTLYIYDVRHSSPITIPQRPSHTLRPHDDYVSSLAPLTPSADSTSALPKQFLTTGGTTLAITDIRKGVISTSEDQEEELTSSLYISGLKAGSNRSGTKAVVGGAGGVLTLWKHGIWDDQDERIVVDREGEAVESLARVPEGLGNLGYQSQQKLVAAGLGNGTVKFVRLGPNRVEHHLDIRHDDVEGVAGLAFDTGGRMVTGGGQTLKVWTQAPQHGDDSIHSRHSDDASPADEKAKLTHDDDDDHDSDDELAHPRGKRRKKQKRRKAANSAESSSLRFDLDL